MPTPWTVSSGCCLLVVAATLVGCGRDDQADSTHPPLVRQVRTGRSELAFFTTHGNAIYDLGLADDRGRRLRIVAGESLPNSVTP